MSDELVAELDKVVKRNIGLEEELQKLQVRPNPAILLNLRLNMLVDAIFGEDEEARLSFEIEYQRHITDILMTIHQNRLEEINRQKLLLPNGATLPPGIKL